MFRFFVICIWIQLSAEVDTVIDNYLIHVTDFIHPRYRRYMKKLKKL